MNDDLIEFGTTFPAITNRGVYFVVSPLLEGDLRAATSLEMVQLDAAAPWVLVAVRKLERLGKLREGWDSYGGHPLKPEAKRATVLAINMLDRAQLPVPAVVLASGGHVALEWHSHGKELDVELGKGDGFEYVTSDSDGNMVEGRTDKNNPEQLKRLADWLLHT